MTARCSFKLWELREKSRPHTENKTLFVFHHVPRAQAQKRNILFYTNLYLRQAIEQRHYKCQLKAIKNKNECNLPELPDHYKVRASTFDNLRKSLRKTLLFADSLLNPATCTWHHKTYRSENDQRSFKNAQASCNRNSCCARFIGSITSAWRLAGDRSHGES